MAILQLNNLSNKFISTNEISRLFNCHERYPEKIPYKFILYNQRILKWLGITAQVAENNGQFGVQLSSSNLIGSAPLRDPKTGKYKLDIVVKSRFSEDISSLIDLLEATISPEFSDLELLKTNTVRAPIYFDCINYILAFQKAINTKWRKFSVREQIESYPKGSTNWTKYAQKSCDTRELLRYPNRNNILLIDHPAWQKLCYVLKFALDTLKSQNVPQNIRIKYQENISQLTQYLIAHKTTYTRDEFHISPHDPLTIKELKGLANILITLNRKNAKAWRIDSSELFERYVQHICKLIGKRMGGEVRSNPKMSIKGFPYLPAWSLKYLEPDVILRIENTLIPIDAKYKAHMLNHSGSELKETFRSDLHQVLAYSSFCESANKTSWIFYPFMSSESNEENITIKKIKLEITSPVSNSNITTYLFGISLKTSDIPNIVDNIIPEINKIVSIPE